MTVNIGTLITATQYNSVQATISLVLGAGSADFGYGQSITSQAVAPTYKVSVTQWNNLRNDIVRARQHQTSVTINDASPTDPGYVDGASLKIPTTFNKITAADYNEYEKVANAAYNNHLAIPSSPTQATRENLVGVQTRTANWNSAISQTITVDFGSADAARYFFNTGSRMEFSSSRTGGVGGPKDVSWTTILTGMGTIYFNRTNTTCTGSGTTSAIGWTSLTSSNQLIFSKDLTGTTYYPNSYTIYARAPIPSQIVFTISWTDSATSTGHDPAWAIDEDVTGTLTSTVQVYRSTGDVVIAKPSAATSGI